jgi:hypothetical protein
MTASSQGRRSALASPAEAAWAERVVANRDQVDRVREVPDGRDFYAPVSSLFRVDPRRTGDAVVEALLALAEPTETWLDIGAGAGRFALPLALHVRQVIAIDPSTSMLTALREQQAEHGITNVRTIEGRWPPDRVLSRQLGRSPVADVALIAHVGYDVEAIGPFMDAMEAAARRRCVAVLMERQPASLADPFWLRVHGEERSGLPALPEFLALLRERGREHAVSMLPQERRRFASRDELRGFLRRQLWIADGGPKELRFERAFDELVVDVDGGVALLDQPPLAVGVVTWTHHGGDGHGTAGRPSRVSRP